MTIKTVLAISLSCIFGATFASNGGSDPLKQGVSKKSNALKDSTEVPKEEAFKPSVQVGSIVHMFASATQSGFGSPSVAESSKDWNSGFSLYRARILVGGQLSKNGSFFLETEIPSIIGGRNGDGTKNVKVSQVILDAQYEHTYTKNHMVVVGKQLVSHNRNGLQGAASLMANDFTFFQYPYNLFETSPLQGNFGRDLGVNFRGFLLDEKLEYRLGAFTGRTFEKGSTPRVVGRVAYNFLEAEKDYYYAGTKIGGGKTAALAAGFDVQGTYTNIGADFFLDVPVSDMGSITLNTAYSYITGGTDTLNSYSFAQLIPTQTTEFLELGYFFKESKLQPWVRYERQAMNADPVQTGGIAPSMFNELNSTVILGGGLNYWYNDYGTNLRLSYTTWNGNALDPTTNETKSQSYGQLWLQVQFFVF